VGEGASAMAASVRVLRMRVVAGFFWLIVGLLVFSNYMWRHYPPPTCKHPGQYTREFLLCPDDDASTATDSGGRRPGGLTPQPPPDAQLAAASSP
jgi:hypothetical protein